jgi:putative membrane protein
MTKKKKPGLLASLVVNTLSIFTASYLLDGVSVNSFSTALIMAVILAVLNVTVKPFLILVTFPITLLSLGLFLVVINIIVMMIADSIVVGFHIDGFIWALLFSIVVSIVNGVLFELSK